MIGRVMYIPKEIATSFGHVETVTDRDLNTVKARVMDFSAISILKILSQLQDCPKTFSDLYMYSGIRYKRSYIRYLHLCTKYKFVSRVEQHPRVFYHITDKGRTMLSLFIDESKRHN
ncbi:MAG: hypothetical protein K8823_807 [Cenarchaeum symbiont of Oopsacas minuta]|nr:hypothetical protein [Cenarchaeum symbiont of Oopsacas minuta]